MKEILAALKAGEDIKIGNRGRIFMYSDGTITIRRSDSLMGPTERLTIAGLNRILLWLDNNPIPERHA